jgi:DNA-binding CsgD family transcriptional regulator/GAF domain-containing protein
MQRDLALQFAQLSDLGEALTLILKTGIEVSGMEAGGIWLKQEQTGDLELICSIGVPEGVIHKIGRLKSGTPDWSLWMEGKMVHMPPNKEQTPLAYEDGATYVVIAPILGGGQVIGSLSLASHLRGQIAEQGRLSLDFLSAELGNIIARMQARQRLEQEVQTRRDAEKALQAERLNLQEVNAALKVLLRQREADRKELEDKVVSNVKELVLPHLEKLKKSRLDASQEMTVDSVEATLKEILSPFLENTRRFNLTPRQTQIVAFIKDGRTTKEIAELLHISKAAVDKHRYLIRERLGLSNGKTNLRSYLLSLA